MIFVFEQINFLLDSVQIKPACSGDWEPTSSGRKSQFRILLWNKSSGAKSVCLLLYPTYSQCALIIFVQWTHLIILQKAFAQFTTSYLISGLFIIWDKCTTIDSWHSRVDICHHDLCTGGLAWSWNNITQAVAHYWESFFTATCLSKWSF